MECLIDNSSLDKLRQHGVVAISDGTDDQSIIYLLSALKGCTTNALPDSYVREFALIAKLYAITAYVLVPGSMEHTKAEELREKGMTVVFSKNERHCDRDLLAQKATELGAYQFPFHDEADAIHGYGTVALELEDEVRRVLETQSTVPSQEIGKLDAVIAVMGNGSALCGICMAFQKTGTKVFGADTLSGDGGIVRNGNFFYPENKGGGCQGPPQAFNTPMGALCWSVFTSPGLLSAVLYVDHKSSGLAQAKLVEQLRIDADLNDAAPLALVLYSEDIRQFLEKEMLNGRTLNVGIIIRSVVSDCEHRRRNGLSKSPEDDLTQFLRIMYW